jgi:hypothetical protein
MTPAQKKRYDDLVAKHPRLKKHNWRFDSRNNQWWPTIPNKARATVREVWEEYNQGTDDLMDIRTLETEFQHHWKFDNASVTTKRTKRKKITDLIDRIKDQKRLPVDHIVNHVQGILQPTLRPTDTPLTSVYASCRIKVLGKLWLGR